MSGEDFSPDETTVGLVGSEGDSPPTSGRDQVDVTDERGFGWLTESTG